MSETIPVRVRECPDGTHPDGDVVYLRAKLGWVGGAMLRHVIDDGRKSGDVRATTEEWMDGVLRYGAVGWNLHDEDGDRPFDLRALLDDYDFAEPVGIRASELYYEQVVAPLVPRRPKSSKRGPTVVSISDQRKSPTSGRRRSSAAGSAGKRSRKTA